MIAIRPLPIEVKVICSSQTTLNLLFKEHERGLYTQDFAKVAGFPRADFKHAYLVGADFEGAQCQGADFKHAQCQGADFLGAQCQEARFSSAQCQGARFASARYLLAIFILLQCQFMQDINCACARRSFT
jgi:uncharacterized protein YjbI with pentapeptide repeats